MARKVMNNVVCLSHCFSWTLPHLSRLGASLLSAYVEFSNAADLQASMDKVMLDMFGDLLGETDAAVIYSRFGGLYGTADLHPKKTGSRAIDAMIQKMLTGPNGKTFSGGFWWSLNPDNSWPHPAPDSSEAVNAGLLDPTWRAADLDQLAATNKMNDMPDLAFLPCDPR
jgi:endoglucanase